LFLTEYFDVHPVVVLRATGMRGHDGVLSQSRGGRRSSVRPHPRRLLRRRRRRTDDTVDPGTTNGVAGADLAREDDHAIARAIDGSGPHLGGDDTRGPHDFATRGRHNVDDCDVR
jgi:hypothetical protein